jgi:acid phosphatase type 7
MKRKFSGVRRRAIVVVSIALAAQMLVLAGNAAAYTRSPATGQAAESRVTITTRVTDRLNLPPTPPTNVQARAIDAYTVRVTWDPSIDDRGIKSYNVYRDGGTTRIGTVPGSKLSFTDTTVAPATQYSYGVQALDTAKRTSARSAPATVTTPSSSAPVIGAAGDIACSSLTPTSTTCHQQATADLLPGVDAVLPLGDLQYNDATLQEFQAYYDRSWGKYLSISHPAVGNHEYVSSSTADGYFDYFGARAGPRPQGWYSFTLGSWHVISLNANCSNIGGCGASSPQYKWLQSDLAAASARCTLAYWHQPLFATGAGTASVKPFWDLLYAAHADVVLNGHRHDYERFAPQTPSGTASSSGIREFVVGTGGMDLGGFGTATPAPTSEIRNGTTFGILKMTLHATSYDWRFVPEAGKTFTDSGTGSCI